MLHASVRRKGKEIFAAQALNDAVIQKDARARLLDLDIAVNGEPVMRLRADGLICSTPTGSTAYSLAAGGSIVHPALEVLLVTPICAHSLSARPLILKLSDKLLATIPEYDGTMVLTIDGQLSIPLQTGDAIEIGESPYRIKLVQSSSRSYFDILRTKLNWGIANKGE
jgi:NAD+ kinase